MPKPEQTLQFDSSPIKSTGTRACELNKASRHELLPLEGDVGAVKPSESSAGRKEHRAWHWTGPRGRKALSSSTHFSGRTVKQTHLDPPHCAFPAHRPDAVVLVSVPITVPVAPAALEHL